MEAPRLELMPLSALQGAPSNPKEHDIGALCVSLRRFGFVAPALLDEATGRLVAGHGRVAALEALRDSGEPAPDRVHTLPDGDWAIPVVRGLSFKTPEEAAAYLIADNRLTQLGGWDDAALLALLQDVNDTPGGLDGTGYDGNDLQGLFDLLEGRPPSEPDRPPPDAPPAPPEEPKRPATYAVLVPCKDEEEMQRVSEELRGLGYDVQTAHR
ncbi:MAG TPA: hypothetical protein VHN99_06600 [Deinococcales bacterium]|nr:hypothetical protein [Deinococcales bacterium]